MKQKTSNALAAAMTKHRRDFSLQEIYRIVCRPPHQEMLTTEELHRRCSRAIGEARKALKKEKLLLILGEKRHSYRVVERKR
jgi:hypothetical protein